LGLAVDGTLTMATDLVHEAINGDLGVTERARRQPIYLLVELVGAVPVVVVLVSARVSFAYRLAATIHVRPKNLAPDGRADPISVPFA
jgi:hypothetical protein